MNVSVCVLSYERPEFLRQCLRTIRQAGMLIELIVHDDGSKNPEVYRVLEGALNRNEISTLILNPKGHNQGVGCAINRCFDVAQGELLIKADQDLVFKPGWLTKALKVLEDPKVGLMGFFAYHHDPVDVKKTFLGRSTIEGSSHSYHTHICASAFTLSRALYKRFGIQKHSDSFSEDCVLMSQIRKIGLFCALADEDLVENVGFGIPLSTVVPAENQVHTIHHGPFRV